MTLWIIEPRDPLIARDGRPFGPDPGARAETLSFPTPSMVVGSLRHKAGLTATGRFDRASIERVKSLTLRGPLLVELGHDGQIKQFLFPAPADAVVFDYKSDENKSDQLTSCQAGAAPSQRDTNDDKNQPDNTKDEDKQKLELRWAQPVELAAFTNLPDDLTPVAIDKVGKPSQYAPQFWHEATFYQWLLNPLSLRTIAAAELGIGSLPRSIRTHVSIATQTQTAREGALFQTAGLEFAQRDNTGSLSHIRHFALAAAFEDEHGQPYTPPHFAGGLAPLGGERRIARWSQVAKTLPEPPAELVTIIKENRCARVILLSPAAFADGYRPPIAWSRGNATAKLQAAVVPRAQVISGWDLAENKPKPTRRLAPAGSVYFVSWEKGEDAVSWLHATWMRNVSDEAQDCRDGFGLAVVGVWK